MTTLSVVIPMYRSGGLTAAVVTALVRCRLREGATLEIIVVDDGSGDGSSKVVEALGHPDVTVLALERNVGRSAARNRGAAKASGDRILFLDSDCIPVDSCFLEAHLATLDRGIDVSMGAAEGSSDGFWHEYQAAAAARRMRASIRDGVALHGSSPNFMLSRDLFLSVDGFDEEYRGYGFEDRDLFLRIAQAGSKAAWSPEARVTHRDTLDLRNVCIKMAAAGGAPAIRFRERHPEAYQALGYGKLDTRHRAWLRLLEPVVTRATCLALPWLESRLDRGPLPLAWRMRLVRLLVAASYVHGTAHQGDNAFLMR
jgi:glycosyltransferase involved in cell wall biosynthesis